MARLTRAFGRRRGTRLHGIRFRLGLAMAVALLPILVLGAFQANRAFEAQDADQRADLQLAVERTSATAKARLDSTSVLLQALRPEALELFCRPRLTSLVQRLEDIDGLARLSASGQTTCASDNLSEPLPAWLSQAPSSEWFKRLRAGEDTILARAPDVAGVAPGLIVAIRL